MMNIGEIKKYLIQTSLIIMLLLISSTAYPQTGKDGIKTIDVSGFYDSAHHWKDITDHEQVIQRLPNQKKYRPDQIKEIADNILLYQQKNGGWPKNYDMQAILTSQQKKILAEGRDSLNTTFDNGATHSQIEYLAKAYTITHYKRYEDAAVRGIKFILKAQYYNGGWPQFYPDTSGYRKYITFNDGAMIGVMDILRKIVQNNNDFSFVKGRLKKEAEKAFDKGIDCILKCQIKVDSEPTVWCQQHDNIDLKPRGARTFELPSKCGEESAGIVLFLMKLNNPGDKIIKSVTDAADWFRHSELHGIRVKRISAPKIVFKYRTSVTDKTVLNDPAAPPIWARFYTLKGNRPFFSDRNSVPVYKLSEVGRERRDGYTWYTYAPQEVLDKYPVWIKNIRK